MQKQIDKILSKYEEDIKKIGLDIHSNPELGYEEFKACKWQEDYLEKQGFQVEKEYKGVKTAYKASFGTGKPVVCITSEYDALPEIGHACGHNLMAGCSLATGLILKELIESEKIDGTLLIIGTPAEESGGGKVVLIEKGGFENIDIALMAHPNYFTSPSLLMAAVNRYNINFKGQTSHAADSPEKGLNALDATRLLFNGVDCWRQQLPETSRVHGVITNGGERPNIIPDKGSSFWYLRSFDNDYLDGMKQRFENIAKGAALMTGTEVEIIHDKTPYKVLNPNKIMNQTFFKEATNLGLKPEWREPCRASTDFGDISDIMPAIQPFFDITNGAEIALHTKEFAECASSEFALEQMLRTSQVLAKIGYKYFTDNEYRNQIQDS